MDLDKEAMKCAVEMEVETALFTTTRSKGDIIKRYLQAAYDAGRNAEAAPSERLLRT